MNPVLSLGSTVSVVLFFSYTVIEDQAEYLGEPLSLAVDWVANQIFWLNAERVSSLSVCLSVSLFDSPSLTVSLSLSVSVSLPLSLLLPSLFHTAMCSLSIFCCSSSNLCSGCSIFITVSIDS